MKRAIFLVCLIFPFLVFSQEAMRKRLPEKPAATVSTPSDIDHSTQSREADWDYKNVDEAFLKGAVPEENNKVVFRYSIPTFFQSEKAVFENLRLWRDRLTASTKIQQTYIDSAKYEVALLVDDHLKFKPSLYYVEETDVSFNLLLKVHPDRCELIVRDIKYNYVEAQKKIEARAEGMIADKVALAKDGQLSRYYDKFRVHTLDLVWNVRERIEDRVAGERIENAKGFKQVAQVPGRFSSLLSSDLTLLTFTGEKIEDVRLKEGDADLNTEGTDIYLTKKTALKSGDIFTLSFYTEAYREMLDKLKLSKIRTSSAGLSHPEAWLIVECQMTDDGMDGWAEGKIISIWIK